jgi:hypothetical protein
MVNYLDLIAFYALILLPLFNKGHSDAHDGSDLTIQADSISWDHAQIAGQRAAAKRVDSRH